MGELDDVKELIKMLKGRGYSDKAIKEVLRWYCDLAVLRKVPLSQMKRR